MKNLPNKITYSRFIFGIIFTYFAYQNNLFFFLIFYVLAIGTDILDGMLARILNQKSEHGKKLDIIADEFILICLLFSFYFLKKELIFRYINLILFMFTYFIIAQLISLYNQKKIILIKTKASTFAAIIFPFIVIISIFFQTKSLIYFYSILMIYSLTEKIFLTMKKRKIKKNKAIFITIIALLSFILFSLPISEKKDRVCFPDGYCVNVEVKDTKEERMLGLMFRESLDEDEGMLFIFEKPDTYLFWMKNMKMSIDIIFLDEDKNIVYIAENAPPCTDNNDNNCKRYGPNIPALYVVETVPNFATKHNLKIGDNINFFISNES